MLCAIKRNSAWQSDSINPFLKPFFKDRSKPCSLHGRKRCPNAHLDITCKLVGPLFKLNVMALRGVMAEEVPLFSARVEQKLSSCSGALPCPSLMPSLVMPLSLSTSKAVLCLYSPLATCSYVVACSHTENGLTVILYRVDSLPGWL